MYVYVCMCMYSKGDGTKKLVRWSVRSLAGREGTVYYHGAVGPIDRRRLDREIALVVMRFFSLPDSSTIHVRLSRLCIDAITRAWFLMNWIPCQRNDQAFESNVSIDRRVDLQRRVCVCVCEYSWSEINVEFNEFFFIYGFGDLARLKG